MKATEAKLLEFIKKSPQFVIPIYQRTYSWGERECRQLWEDILRTGSKDEISAHFVGSIVYVEKGLYQVTSQSPLLVIDGQQRLTTVSLLLAALAKALDKPGKDNEPLEGFSPRKLRNYYLLNPEEEGDRHYKLVLSQTDKDTLIAIAGNKGIPKDHSIRVKANYSLFEEWIAALNGDFTAICKGLAKLVIVDISLNRDQDNPQLIFESMNSTGRELTQADLIRNFILMGLEPKLQTQLYTQYWRPMELDFGQEAYGTHFDGFMRHYLTVKTGEIPNINAVYDKFKTYARPRISTDGVEALVADIRNYAGYFCAMALVAEKDKDLKLAFQDLRELKVDVAYPLLLELYHDYANGVLSKDDFVSAVRLVEAYVFRRVICAIPTNSMNKTFAGFGKALKKDCYLESIQAHFLLQQSYRRFPNDAEFVHNLKERDLYNLPGRRSYWLRRMENHGRKERVAVDDYTIEHIMPQSEDLPERWKEMLGPEWDRIHKTLLHTLGNLTLTGYNSEYSDRPFHEKRDMKGGFKESPLRLNQGLGRLEQWNEAEIQKRAERLAGEAIKVWSAPKLVTDVLADYRVKASESDYTIEHHPYLLRRGLNELFEAFRKEVLALDDCVTEEFKKHYVAYKAETNFVDVEGQASRLKLTLNMSFAEINDPRKLCRDISNVGHWTNGDVRVGLTSLDDLPYILGLVRQALEKQLGNGEGE